MVPVVGDGGFFTAGLDQSAAADPGSPARPESQQGAAPPPRQQPVSPPGGQDPWLFVPLRGGLGPFTFAGQAAAPGDAAGEAGPPSPPQGGGLAATALPFSPAGADTALPMAIPGGFAQGAGYPSMYGMTEQMPGMVPSDMSSDNMYVFVGVYSPEMVPYGADQVGMCWNAVPAAGSAAQEAWGAGDHRRGYRQWGANPPRRERDRKAPAPGRVQPPQAGAAAARGGGPKHGRGDSARRDAAEPPAEPPPDDDGDDDEDGSGLAFVAQRPPAPTFQPPPPEQERQLRGELLFLRAWPVVSEAAAAARSASDGAPAPGPTEALQLCGKAVGMLLQLPAEEVSQMLGSSAMLQASLRNALRGLLPRTAQRSKAKAASSSSSGAAPGAGGATSSTALPPGGGPPPERHGDLLCVAVTPLVGDGRLAMRVVGILLQQLSPEQVCACLAEEKRLQSTVKGILCNLEREQREEKDARRRLMDFLRLKRLQRAETLRSPGSASTEDQETAGETPVGGHTSAIDLLRLARKHTRQPEVVALCVARALAVARLPVGPPLAAAFHECGIDRAKLAALRLQLPTARQAKASGPKVAHGEAGPSEAPVAGEAPADAAAPSSRRARSRPKKRSPTRRAPPGEAPEAAPPPAAAPGKAPEAGDGTPAPAGEDAKEEGFWEAKEQEAEPQRQEEPRGARSAALASPKALAALAGGRAVPGVISAPSVVEAIRERERRPRSPEPELRGRARPPQSFLEAARRPTPEPAKAAPARREAPMAAEFFPALAPQAAPRAAGLVLAPKKKGVLVSRHVEMQARPSRRSSSMDALGVQHDASESRPLPSGSAWAPRHRAASAEPVKQRVAFAEPEIVPVEPDEAAARPAPPPAAPARTRSTEARPARPARESAAQDSRRLGAKRKGHMWSPVADAFELARERAKSQGPTAFSGQRHIEDADGNVTVFSAPPTASAKGAAAPGGAAVATAQDARLRLRALQEAKLEAVEREDFDLAARLKAEEQGLRRLVEECSWASVAKAEAAPEAPRPRGPAAAGPGRPPASLRAASADGAALFSDGRAAPRSRGGLVFFLPAPGELEAESFRPTTTHVARRDAIARIASAALWRGRGLAWQDVREVVFLFDDKRLLRITPRFVASCPVPSEYHLVMVLGRAVEREDGGVPGMRVLEGDTEEPFGGHIERVVGEYASAGPMAAVLLHETYPQALGVYGDAPQAAASRGAEEPTLLFFLGAVRDMLPEEIRSVQRACRARRVPLLEANLGQQAEFTSKIIDVLQGHHLHGRLAPAVWQRARSAVAAAPRSEPSSGSRPPKGLLWVFVPVPGGPRDLAADDRKKDGMYEVPRCCIAQLWCSKSEHSSHLISFVFAGGEVLTVSSALVTCLKLQHRAAPTERNLVNALRVGMGDHKADSALTIDPGCVTLGDVAQLQRHRPQGRGRVALVDLQLGGDHIVTPRMEPYTAPAEASPGPRDVALLVRQAEGRDFPKGFRERLADALTDAPVKRPERGIVPGMPAPEPSSSRFLHVSLPQMSSHSAISLLGHYWAIGRLSAALAARRGRVAAKARPAAEWVPKTRPQAKATVETAERVEPKGRAEAEAAARAEPEAPAQPAPPPEVERQVEPRAAEPEAAPIEEPPLQRVVPDHWEDAVA